MGDSAETALLPSYHTYLIDQDWGHYSSEEHKTWGTLFTRQMDLLGDRACEEYLDGVKTLGLNDREIPDFTKMNERLMAATGWQVIAVPGLVPSRPFFDMLKERKFPAGTFIRRPDQLDYLEEPDIFHDVFGHVPLLTNPAYADYMEAYGRAGDDALEHKGVKYLARLNWYTIEFGLIRKPDGMKIYGAGIASSFGESKYALDDPSPHYLQFDLERILRTGYYIDDFQATYFVVDSFEKLFEECVERPFVPLYHKFRDMEDLTPFELLESDTVLRKGTKEYWKDFPEIKTNLK